LLFEKHKPTTMKKILSVFAIAAVFAACKNNPSPGEDSRVLGMSATEQQKVIKTKGVYDATDGYTASQLNNPNRIKISEEIKLVEENKVIANNNAVKKAYQAAPVKRKAVTAIAKEKEVVSGESRPVYQGNPGAVDNTSNTLPAPATPPVTNNDNADSRSNPEEVVTASTQTAPEPVQKKEGWSHAAKGTVIGAGSGAILGAMVSKKHGKGAIIGGILGAGTGYVFGREKDKKVGRY
jgi:hypothetical protein